jgi:hypothetical protein
MTEPASIASAVAEYQNKQARMRAVAAESRAGEPVEPAAPGRVEQTAGDSRTGWSITLWKLYGGGDRPDLRSAVFRKVQSLASIHGKKLEDQIRDVIRLSRGPDITNSGNYFCRAIMLRVRELGFLDSFTTPFTQR